jgi:hypothetical protein
VPDETYVCSPHVHNVKRGVQQNETRATFRKIELRVKPRRVDGKEVAQYIAAYTYIQQYN